MLNLLVVLVGLFVAFRGFGYRYRDRLGSYYTGGTALLGLLIVIFLVLVLVGAIKP